MRFNIKNLREKKVEISKRLGTTLTYQNGGNKKSRAD